MNNSNQLRVLHYRPNKRSAASFNLLFLRLIVIFAEGKLQLLLRIRYPSFCVVIIIIVLHAIHLHLHSNSPFALRLSKRGGFAHSFIMNCGINSRDLLLSTTIGTTNNHHPPPHDNKWIIDCLWHLFVWWFII